MLEAVVICLDNSDWSRNRDCPPSRLQAQQEAAISLANAKLQANPENSIGLVTLAGEHVEVKASPSGDMGSFHEAIQSLLSDGEANLVKGIQTAQLALKHRLNRNQRQRIVLFICSPLSKSLEDDLDRVGKALKKNNVSIDVISFGEVQHNSALLKKLYQAVNANNTSSLLELQFPIASLARAVASSATEGGGSEEWPRYADPTTDPELLMALRLSLEEERARQQQEAAATNMRTGDAPDSAADAAPVRPTAPVTQGDSCAEVIQEDRPPTAEEIMGLDVDDDLRQALLLSLQSMAEEQLRGTEANEAPPEQKAPAAEEKHATDQEATEKEVFDTPPENASFASLSPRPSEPTQQPLLTPAEMKQLAGMLPNVDLNNEEILRAFRDLAKMEKDNKAGDTTEQGNEKQDPPAKD